MAMEREERWKRMKEMVRETNERVRGWGQCRKREAERRSPDASMVTARPIGRHERQRNSVGCQRRYPGEGLGRQGSQGCAKALGVEISQKKLYS
jgi:hypothetical protein